MLHRDVGQIQPCSSAMPRGLPPRGEEPHPRQRAEVKGTLQPFLSWCRSSAAGEQQQPSPVPRLGSKEEGASCERGSGVGWLQPGLPQCPKSCLSLGQCCLPGLTCQGAFAKPAPVMVPGGTGQGSRRGHGTEASQPWAT